MLDLIKSIQARDADAKPGFWHVLLTCNGLHAVAIHHASHWLWDKKFKLLGQMLSGFGRMITGIEIHPQAQIGRLLYIDHGTGVVIGQTAIVGDNVTLYHGVTLGGKGDDMAGKRHPTLGDNVVIGAGAQILGDITIGDGGKVGANAVVTKDIPPNCIAVGNPARLIKCKGDKGRAYGMPRAWVDPVAEAIDGLMKDVEALKKTSGMREDDRDEEDSYADHWNGSGI